MNVIDDFLNADDMTEICCRQMQAARKSQSNLSIGITEDAFSQQRAKRDALADRLLECHQACAGIEKPWPAMPLARRALKQAECVLRDHLCGDAADLCADALRMMTPDEPIAAAS